MWDEVLVVEVLVPHHIIKRFFYIICIHVVHYLSPKYEVIHLIYHGIIVGRSVGTSSSHFVHVTHQRLYWLHLQESVGIISPHRLIATYSVSVLSTISHLSIWIFMSGVLSFCAIFHSV